MNRLLILILSLLVSFFAFANEVTEIEEFDEATPEELPTELFQGTRDATNRNELIKTIAAKTNARFANNVKNVIANLDCGSNKNLSHLLACNMENGSSRKNLVRRLARCFYIDLQTNKLFGSYPVVYGRRGVTSQPVPPRGAMTPLGIFALRPPAKLPRHQYKERFHARLAGQSETGHDSFQRGPHIGRGFGPIFYGDRKPYRTSLGSPVFFEGAMDLQRKLATRTLKALYTGNAQNPIENKCSTN